MYPTLFSTPGVTAFAQEIDAERARQFAKFGDQRHRDGSETATNIELCADLAEQMRQLNEQPAERSWTTILLEEVYEAGAESDPARIRAELIQVAAVCAAWIYDIDRRGATDAQQVDACGKCRQPFNPADTSYNGHARYANTPYCRGCVEHCHDTEIADHACVICRKGPQS